MELMTSQRSRLRSRLVAKASRVVAKALPVFEGHEVMSQQLSDDQERLQLMDECSDGKPDKPHRTFVDNAERSAFREGQTGRKGHSKPTQ